MGIKGLFINVGKLLLCGITLFVGLIVGGILASRLQLQPPPMPEGADATSAAAAFLLESPLFALALALVARGLAGGFLTRALILTLLSWIAYTLNTALDASLYVIGYASASGFQLLSFLVPSVFCGAAVAFLFPPDKCGSSFTAAWSKFFTGKPIMEWAWRIALGAVAFMPIYIVFGLLVTPFTEEYYQQNMYGLQMAGWDQILPVLFVRSLLFLLACLPVLVAWQKSTHSLFLNLGAALFVLVGFLYMLAAYWMPLSVRVPHSLEIFADEFVYAGVLVFLLAKNDSAVNDRTRLVSKTT
jgi:hypothetical protein